jgi:hypothetical protein
LGQDRCCCEVFLGLLLLCGTTFASPCSGLKLPKTWLVRSSFYADLKNEGRPLCALAVWRPWRGWPTARWGPKHPDPVGQNRDAGGRSSHVLLLRPLAGGKYKEIWAGSPLLRPVLKIWPVKVGDKLFLGALEGTYTQGMNGMARAKTLWEWDNFGFKLRSRVRIEGEKT